MDLDKIRKTIHKAITVILESSDGDLDEACRNGVGRTVEFSKESPTHSSEACKPYNLDMAEAPHSSSPSPHSDRGYEFTTPEELTIPVSQALKPMTLASARHQEPWRHKKS